jgi:hypothetical protein
VWNPNPNLGGFTSNEVIFASLHRQVTRLLRLLPRECVDDHIDRDALVLLNITGGGWQRKQRDYTLKPARPALQISVDELLLERTVERIVALFH